MFELAPRPLSCESSKLALHQLHFGEHGDVVPLMRDLEGVPDLLGVVQAAHLMLYSSLHKEASNNSSSLCIFMNLFINKHRTIRAIKLHSTFYNLPYAWMEREQVTTHFVTPKSVVLSIKVRRFAKWNGKQMSI